MGEKTNRIGKVTDEEVVMVVRNQYPYTKNTDLRVIRSEYEGKTHFQVVAEWDDYLTDYAYEYILEEIESILLKMRYQNAR